MNVVLDEGAILPTRAHDTDAGFDLYSRENKIIPAHGSAIFDTGVHIQIPGSLAAVIISKSGLNVKESLTSTGLIDEGYTGALIVKLYNHSDVPTLIERGHKISQFILVPVCTPALNVVDSLDTTERGDNGFGSSGK